MTYQCNFCDAILSSEYSLIKHKKTVKKCLLKQGIVPKGQFKCDICQDTFLCKSHLKSHVVSCNKKNNNKLNIKIVPELKNKNTFIESKLLEIETKYNTLESKYNTMIYERKEIENKYNMMLYELKEIETKYNMLQEEKKEWKEKEEKLLDKITTAAISKTNTVNKNINITTYTRTDDELKTIYANNITTSHIEGGIAAITRLIIDKVVTDDNGVKMITITDKSRGTARYKLPSGEEVVDNGLNTFTTKNRDIVMRRIYSMASSDREISDKILDVDTTISKGFMELNEDFEGDVLRSNLIKNI